MRGTHRCPARAILVSIDEEILDDRIGRQEVETREEQLGIGRHALKDSVSETQPAIRIAVRARRTIGVEQAHEIAQQQGVVHRVRIARVRQHLDGIDRLMGPPHRVAKLRPQVATGEHGAGAVHGQSIRIG